MFILFCIFFVCLFLFFGGSWCMVFEIYPRASRTLPLHPTLQSKTHFRICTILVILNKVKLSATTRKMLISKESESTGFLLPAGAVLLTTVPFIFRTLCESQCCYPIMTVEMGCRQPGQTSSNQQLGRSRVKSEPNRQLEACTDAASHTVRQLASAPLASLQVSPPHSTLHTVSAVKGCNECPLGACLPPLSGSFTTQQSSVSLPLLLTGVLDHRHGLFVLLFYVVQGIKLRALCTLSKCSATIPQAKVQLLTD